MSYSYERIVQIHPQAVNGPAYHGTRNRNQHAATGTEGVHCGHCGAEAGSLIFLTRSFPLKSNCTSQSKLLVRSGRLRGMQVDVGDFLQLTYLYDVSSEDLGELITH